jgi:hypothetical protein
MILKARNQRPIITFGLGNLETNASFGETVFVYLNEKYIDNYEINLFTNLNQTRVNKFTWQIEINARGLQEISVFTSNESKTVERQSNILTIFT